MDNALVAYKEQMAAQAQALAATETVGGSFLSISGGILQLGDEAMPGNQVCAVIIDAVRENTYYEGDYNADAPLPPVCYAFGRTEQEMAPHFESMALDKEYFMPQADACKGCPRNEWGSAERGKGKACQNRRRLTLVPAGYYQARPNSRDLDLHLFDDPAHYAMADAASLKLPVTSVENWAKYVQFLAATHHLPPHGAITRVYVEPHPKFQYMVKFELVEVLPDSFLPNVIARNAAAAGQPFRGYTSPDAEKAPF